MINWTAISAIGSLASAGAAAVAACIAVWATLANTRRQGESAAAEMWWRIDERFSSPHMLRIRVKAAECVLANRYEAAAVDEMLDFFEFVGGLERRGLVPIEMLWHSLFEWVRAYWVTCSGKVAKMEGDNPQTWADFGRLYQRLLEVEVRDGRPSHDPYIEDDARRLLKGEVELLS